MCLMDVFAPETKEESTVAPVQQIQPMQTATAEETKKQADYAGDKAKKQAQLKAAQNRMTLTSGLASEQASVNKKTLLGS